MLLLLTEETGYYALINTDYLVSATVERPTNGKEPIHTVVSLSDGTNLYVQEEPDTMLDKSYDQALYAEALFNQEPDDYEPEDQCEEQN